MSKNQSYYELLEVEPSAAPASIKAAYRRLARRYHPDQNPGKPEAETMFKRIGEAYAVLSDPHKRALYDQALGFARGSGATRGDGKRDSRRTQSRSPSAGKTASTGTARKAPPPRSKTTADGSSRTGTDGDGSARTGAGFREMFDALFRKVEPRTDDETAQKVYARSAAGNQARRGEDVTVEMVISREEAQAGVVKTVNVQHTETCRRCSGTGKVNGRACPVCQGERQTITLRKIDVRVPAGVKSGSKVRVAGEGGRGAQGGDPGDLFLVVKIEEDQQLKIDGLTVTCELPVTVVQAVLGAEVEVPTLHGKVKMTVPPLTSSGRVFRLKGQGVSLNGMTGDQFVTVQIVLPKTLSPREKELFEELARLQQQRPS